MKFPPAKRNAKDRIQLRNQAEMLFDDLYPDKKPTAGQGLALGTLQAWAYDVGVSRGFEMGQVMPKFNTEQNTETNPETNPETETTSP